MATLCGSILCGQEHIPYELAHKAVKNINLHVRPDGVVAVSAPRRVSQQEVEQILLKKGSFLRAARQRQALRAEQAPPPHFGADGEQFRILGKRRTLRIEEAPENKVCCTDGSLLLYIPPKTSSEKRLALLHDWLMVQCRNTFTQAAQDAATLLSDRVLPNHIRLRVRRMTSRWGSCIPAKSTITLSTRLLELPWPCIQAIVLHEYVHFLQPNHSAAFYAEIERVMPDYHARTAVLRSLPYSYFFNE